MAKGPRSSSRVTVPQGVMFGGPEEGVVEVGQDEWQGVEINVEEVEAGTNKDDCMVGRVMMDFCTRAPLELHPALERQCGVHGVHSMSRHEKNSRVAYVPCTQCRSCMHSTDRRETSSQRFSLSQLQTGLTVHQ